MIGVLWKVVTTSHRVLSIYSVGNSWDENDILLVALLCQKKTQEEFPPYKNLIMAAAAVC